ncbi:MAG: VOC family protein [Bacteroidetes bacterium]|nr:MAG: VOC family protein [Bacteroidota bacterium]
MKKTTELDRKYISGIQQIGIGVSNFGEAWKWYIPNFGMDIRMFEDKATAEYMLPHTDGLPWERHACLAMNIMGGGGFEIWQHTQRTPLAPTFELQLGDLGIIAGKIKSNNVQLAYEHLKDANLLNGGVVKDPTGRETFFVKDPYNNIWQVVEEYNTFMNKKKPTGGSYGVTIGTTQPEKAMVLYSDIMGYDVVVYDKEGTFDDLLGVPGGAGKFRRILLQHSEKRIGPFSRLFGPTEIELVQALDRAPEKIFKDRIWGDLGFIHICFDILNMKALKEECTAKGFPFTVDSDIHPSGKPFDMGEAAGHFAYVEDPDGTLIEFVETHKIPITKRFGWYLNLWKRRDVTKPLPDWMLKTVRFMKAKPHKL